MEEYDCLNIQENLNTLVRTTEYNRLVERCLQKQLIHDVMRRKIETTYTNQLDRHRALFNKITKRGPNAFRKLLEICDHEFHDASDALRRDISIRRGRTVLDATYPIQRLQVQRPSEAHTSSGFTENERLELKEYDGQVKEPTAFKTVKLSTKFHRNNMKCYPMQSANRGVAFIMSIINFQNNKRRDGAEKDKDNLIALFRQMGFKVLYYEDKTAVDTMWLLDELVKSPLLRKTDCFVMTLLTHGTVNNGEIVEFYGGGVIRVEEILKKFSNVNCRYLLFKPKVFFFPFCRGSMTEMNIRSRRKNEVQAESSPTLNGVEDPIVMPTSVFSDMKICYATTVGFEALRDPENGSWYIESMCRIWADLAHDTSLEDLLKLVGERISNRITEDEYIQTAGNEDRGFYQTLFFNPGYYGESSTVEVADSARNAEEQVAT